MNKLPFPEVLRVMHNRRAEAVKALCSESAIRTVSLENIIVWLTRRHDRMVASSLLDPTAVELVENADLVGLSDWDEGR